MGYGFRVEVSGNLALFTRPELKIERMSYEVITPSAARGILEAVMWKPAIRYVIDRIYVLNPIEFTNIRRNEVKSKASADLMLRAMKGYSKPVYINRATDIQQRAALLLKNVRYVIEAHFELTDKAGETDTKEKFYNMIIRRLRKGQCYSMPYLGTREFPARLALWEGEEIPVCRDYADHVRDFGIMLYDMDYSSENIVPIFYRAVMKNGIIDLRSCEVYR